MSARVRWVLVGIGALVVAAVLLYIWLDASMDDALSRFPEAPRTVVEPGETLTVSLDTSQRSVNRLFRCGDGVFEGVPAAGATRSTQSGSITITVSDDRSAVTVTCADQTEAP